MTARTKLVIVVDVSALTEPDLATVDALARLRLAARRLDLDVSFTRACPRLEELLRLADLRVEARGEAEQREHPGGVEEGVQRDDPPR